MTITYNQRASLRDWSQETVDTYLKQEGFSQESLDEVRSIEDPFRQLQEAGHAFARMGWNNFSVTQLAMLVVPWEKHKRHNSFADRLSEAYSDLRDRLNQEHNLRINNMQLLRESTGNYKGNLRNARAFWPNFIPGCNDWKNNVTIPFTIDRKVAQLLGVIWVDGGIDNHPGQIRLQGRQDDEQFYDEFVLDAIQKIFNYTSAVKKKERTESFRKLRPEAAKLITYFTPTVQVSSSAVASWLTDDLNYTICNNDKRRTLPSLNWENPEIRQGFLEGIVASKAAICYMYMGFIDNKNEEFKDAIKELLVMQGISLSEPKRIRDSRYVYISRAQTRHIINNWDMINPRFKKYQETKNLEK